MYYTNGRLDPILEANIIGEYHAPELPVILGTARARVGTDILNKANKIELKLAPPKQEDSVSLMKKQAEMAEYRKDVFDVLAKMISKNRQKGRV